jgi:hypothetical protein
VRHFLNLTKLSGLPILSATAQTDIKGRHSHSSPPWYSPPHSTRCGPDLLGGYCHSSHNCRQTGENPCGLRLSFPPTDRSGLDRLFRRGIDGPDGRRPQRQTRGLEFADDHETGETPTYLCRRELLSDLWAGHPNHQPIQPIRYCRCLGHCVNPESLIAGVFDFVLCTKFGPPSGSHRHCVSLFLFSPTGSP